MARLLAPMLMLFLAVMLGASSSDDVDVVAAPQEALGAIGVVLLTFAVVIVLTSIAFIVHLARKIYSSLGPVN